MLNINNLRGRPAMPPDGDGAMSEYEHALCGMMRVMLDMTIAMGAPRQQLVKELKSLKDSEQLAGRHAAAATIEITMRTAGLR